MNHTMRACWMVAVSSLFASCSPSSPSPTPANNAPASQGSGGMGGSGGGRENPPAPVPVGGAGGMTAPPPGPTPDARAAAPDASADMNRPPGRDAPAAADAAPPPPPPATDAGAAARAIPPTGATCPAGPFGDPLPANRTATLIRANAGSLEGPLWVAEQNTLYFCVVSGVAGMGRIDKLVPGGANPITTFVSGVDVAGLALNPQGAIVAASFDSRNLTRFDPMTGARTSIAGTDRFMARPFNQINDLVIRSDGNIYFTDTSYRQDGRPGQDTTAYYRFSRAGQITRLGAGPQPNGIALSPDGRFLYVSSTEGDPVRRFALDDDGGVVGTPTTFHNAASDGMAMDCAGNLYLTTAGSVRVLAPDGRVLGMITGLGVSTVSNAAFGGADRKTLFITTASALYQIQMNVPGFPN